MFPEIVCYRVNYSYINIKLCAVVVNFQQKRQKFKRLLQIYFFALLVLQKEGTETLPPPLSPVMGYFADSGVRWRSSSES
jgi:hypothetical protein